MIDKLINNNIYANSQGYSYINNLINTSFYKKKIFILLDNNVKKYCLNNLFFKCPLLKNSIIIEIKNGELYKNNASFLYICKILNKNNANRDSLLINFGGGVITDIGGFAASVFQRGIKFINIPTTILAMIDAAVGGKTGINFYNLKNYIGTFTNPVCVLIDNTYIETLSNREILSGFSEMIKYFLIYNDTLWNKIKFCKIKNLKNYINKYIVDSIYIKYKIVAKDPLEKGLRKILNFGHTIGHALETYFIKKKNYLLHGEAVALGIICETWISYKIFKFPYQDYLDVFLFIKKIFYNRNIINNINEINIMDLINIMYYDKKNIHDDKLNFSLLKCIGCCSYDNLLTHDLIKESLNILKDSIK